MEKKIEVKAVLQKKKKNIVQSSIILFMEIYRFTEVAQTVD